MSLVPNFFFWVPFIVDWMSTHDGDVPTLYQMRNIWYMDRLVGDGDGKISLKDYEEMLIWYYEYVLLAGACNTYWKKSIHRYNLPTDKIKPEHHDHSVICVARASEAYVQLVFHNSRHRYIKHWQLKNEGKKIPLSKKDATPEEIEIYDFCLGKYTLQNSGNQKYGGWSDEGLDLYAELLDEVGKFRKEDLENTADPKKMQKYALDLVRKKHGITENNPKIASKKKKSKSSPVAPAPKRIRRFIE